jgi:hypothetical protein
MPPRLVADGMLGSLARKLRLYGIDVLYFPDLPDPELLERARVEGRTLLTSDRELHLLASRKGISCIFLLGQDDVALAAQVFRELGVTPSMEVALARCPLCNGQVAPAEKSEVSGRVPPGVLSRQKRFYQCSSCHQVYWEGSHWLRLARFDEQVKEALRG